VLHNAVVTWNTLHIGPSWSSFAQAAQEFPFSSHLNSEFVCWKRSSYDPGHNMGLGTKNRQKQTADICKQHLREKYRDKLGLVEEFIVEFEGARKNCDVMGQFTDIKRHQRRDAQAPRGAL
jgi:hypothetical protein